MNSLDSLELRIHPPVLWVLCALPAFTSGLPSGIDPLSIILAGASGLFGIAALASFALARTTYKPNRPENTRILVTSGVYKLSRNPMYLGLVLLLLGVYLAVKNSWGFLMIPLFVFWLQRFQIQVEERVLKQKFGVQYLDYCAAVRRWL